MAASYKIHQVISESKKTGGMQVVVMVDGKSVTRHIRRGQGFNPDGRAVSMHQSVDRRTTSLEGDKGVLEREIKRLENLLNGDQKMTPASREELAEALTQVRKGLKVCVAELAYSKERKAHLEREMPLVAYFQV